MAETNDAINRKYLSIKGSELPQENQAEKVWTLAYRGEGDDKESVRYFFTDSIVQLRGNNQNRSISQATFTKEVEAIEKTIGKLETDLSNKIDEKVEKLEKSISDTKDELNKRITSEVATLNTRITTEVSTLNKRIDTEVSTLNTKIDTVRKELTERMDEEVEILGKRIDDEVKALTGKIEEVDKRLDKKIDGNISALKQLIESYKEELDLRIDTLSETLNKKIDDHVSELKQLIADNYTELTAKVKKAQETADKGVEDAAAAQKSADEAQATADKGVRDAADAQYTADLAVQKADRAQDTADEAHEKADDNKASIQTLKTDVKTAQETADNAHERIEGLARVNGQSLLNGGNIEISVSPSNYIFGSVLLTISEDKVILLPDDVQQLIDVFYNGVCLHKGYYMYNEDAATVTITTGRISVDPDKDWCVVWYIKQNTALPRIGHAEAMADDTGAVPLPDRTIDEVQLVYCSGLLLNKACYTFDRKANKIIITDEGVGYLPDEDIFQITYTY